MTALIREPLFLFYAERKEELMLDVAIIGCGITGAAAAYELSKYRLSLGVFERENDVSIGTTKANSAILHAGYDAEPGTLMAACNVEGSRLAAEICRDLDVPYRQTGSMVVAFEDEQVPLLRELYGRGIQNGVSGLALLDGAEARQMEPGLSHTVLGALHAPAAAVVNPWEYALALAETAVRNGAQLYLGCGVTDIRRAGDFYTLVTPRGEFAAKAIINAAGIYADRVHEMAGDKEFTIHANRGEYFILDKSEGNRVSRVIFQCPTREGKGVLVSPTVHGVLLVGPNAEDIPGREDLQNTAEGLRFVAAKASLSVPCVDVGKSIRNFSGLRAVADTGDFVIAESKTAKRFINLAGIKSPGLSAAPAIAKRAVALLKNAGIRLEPKDNFINRRKKIRINELSMQEQNALIAGNPAYGRVVCRCETVTEGEILDALASPIPPRSLDGVKRRCGTGLGRCQGGFCGPRVLEILARELGIPPGEIWLDRDGSFIVTGDNRKEAANV